jgi:outer membrane protein assembly factor BamB
MLAFTLAFCVYLVGDWPQFRGPNSDGHCVDGSRPPLEWSDTKSVAWTVDIPGLGWSSPVVAAGNIYLTTAVQVDEGLSLRAIALSAETGKTLWTQEIFVVPQAPAIHAKNSHASPTPIYDSQSLFVSFGPLGFAKLSAVDGSIRWKNNELAYEAVHGSGGSPVLWEEKLVVICDGRSAPFVAAIDAETGEIAWKTLRSVEARISHSFATPTLATVDGKTQVLAPGPNHMAAYDLSTGAERWRVVAPGWSVVPQPTVAHGLVIYNHDYDHPELIAVKLGGSGDVTDSHVVWRLKRGAPSSPSPVLVGDDLYFVTDKGIASCINAKTGELRWTERLGGDYSASPIFVNGKLLFLDENGLATRVEPGLQFKRLTQNEVPGRTLATPAFSDGAMYLRTDERLYKIASQ